MTKILINNIKLRLDDDESQAIEYAKRIAAREGLKTSDIELSIYKRSIDARDKNDILLVYSVLATSPLDIIPRDGSPLKILDSADLDPAIGSEPLCDRPLIVGMGPAGMFCALLLAERGYRPIIIDRGDDVKRRSEALERFVKEGVLDLDSNVQFGAGGAGTFSDGKLTTRINDSRCSYILDRFVEFGAPREILTRAKPHIGTDILCGVVDNILSRIEELGGEVIYRCRMDSIRSCSDHVEISTPSGDISAGVAVLALGHSARDTYRMLLDKGLLIEPKPFSVGVRVEHLQSDIDEALYGRYAGHKKLGAAEYNLSDTRGKRGVYTFCMCPGGEVMPATSQEYGVCVNGMSRYARDGRNANCAVNVSVNTDDYGNDPIKSIEFQEDLERRAYRAGGGDYFAPVHLMGDLIEGKAGRAPSRIMPTYGGGRTRVADLSSILPSFVTERLREGFLSFDRRLRGFAVDDAVLTGVETRTSSPVRIMRGEKLTSPTAPRVYPCGEGAGYSGGIMSSAVDGIKVATEIITRYRPQY